MEKLLLFLGIISISIGLNNIKYNKDREDRHKNIIEKKEFKNILDYNLKYNALEKRVDRIENILLKDRTIGVDKIIVEDVSIDDKNKSIEKSSLNTYIKIKRLEKENKSIEEICKLLNMNKGEVILLKNLYKNY